MSDILILALSSGIFFFILELFTITFYGLSLSIASFVVAGYIYLTGDTTQYVIHAIIFFLVAGVCTALIPKVYSRFFPDSDQIVMKNNYLDEHVGKTFVVKGDKESLKISIDGVDYLIHEDSVDGLKSGQKVVLKGTSGSKVHVVVPTEGSGE